MKNFDAVIIGAGPGGTECASVLLKHEKKVAIIEKGSFGGVCLNCGCIPTKMLLGSIEPGRLLEDLEKRKIETGSVSLNYKNLQNRVKRHIAGVSSSIGQQFEAMGANLYKGAGRIIAPGLVKIMETGQELKTENIIIAAGSSPAFFPNLEPDHISVLDSTDLMFIPAPPKSLCIIGAGAIGLELADFFSYLDCKITIVEAAGQILPTEDQDIAETLANALIKKGYTLHTGTAGQKITSTPSGIALELKDGQAIIAEKALVATGRKANTSDLGCENAGIKLDAKGFIKVNAHLEAAPGIYAIGDVNGKVLLAHAAAQQGNYAARAILSSKIAPYSTGPIPSCVYCHPGVMRAGLSEKEAAKNGKFSVSKSNFGINPIAQAHAAPEGFSKAVWQGGKLCGMAAIGLNATQLVTAAELLVAGEYNAEKLEQLMIAHPTLDETLAQTIYAPRKSQ